MQSRVWNSANDERDLAQYWVVKTIGEYGPPVHELKETFPQGTKIDQYRHKANIITLILLSAPMSYANVRKVCADWGYLSKGACRLLPSLEEAYYDLTKTALENSQPAKEAMPPQRKKPRSESKPVHLSTETDTA